MLNAIRTYLARRRRARMPSRALPLCTYRIPSDQEASDKAMRSLESTRKVLEACKAPVRERVEARVA